MLSGKHLKSNRAFKIFFPSTFSVLKNLIVGDTLGQLDSDLSRSPALSKSPVKKRAGTSRRVNERYLVWSSPIIIIK